MAIDHPLSAHGDVDGWGTLAEDHIPEAEAQWQDRRRGVLEGSHLLPKRTVLDDEVLTGANRRLQMVTLCLSVPSAIVGPTEGDLCSATLDVRIPLRGEPGRWQKGKAAVKTTATTYDGQVDVDKLKLICVPPGS